MNKTKKAIAELKRAHRKGPVQIATAGAILGAIGAGLAASTSAASLVNVVPAWAVWAGGALICACVTTASIIRHWTDR